MSLLTLCFASTGCRTIEHGVRLVAAVGRYRSAAMSSAHVAVARTANNDLEVIADLARPSVLVAGLTLLPGGVLFGIKTKPDLL